MINYNFNPEIYPCRYTVEQKTIGKMIVKFMNNIADYIVDDCEDSSTIIELSRLLDSVHSCARNIGLFIEYNWHNSPLHYSLITRDDAYDEQAAMSMDKDYCL